MDLSLLKTSAKALLPNLRVWDGWKIRLPIDGDFGGIWGAIHDFETERKERYSIEVGMCTQAKVNLSILVSKNLQYTREQMDQAFESTAKDGDVCVLAPLKWAADPDVRSVRELMPDMFVLPDMRTAAHLLEIRRAWFVWSRERTGVWRVLPIVSDRLVPSLRTRPENVP